MKTLIITIETDANISKDNLTTLGVAATDYILESLKSYWGGATTQSSKVKVDYAG